MCVDVAELCAAARLRRPAISCLCGGVAFLRRIRAICASSGHPISSSHFCQGTVVASLEMADILDDLDDLIQSQQGHGTAPSAASSTEDISVSVRGDNELSASTQSPPHVAGPPRPPPTRCRDNRPTHQRPAHPPMLLYEDAPNAPLHWQQLRQFGKRPRCQLLRPRQVRSHRSPSRRT